jgi:hypothetical protein
MALNSPVQMLIASLAYEHGLGGRVATAMPGDDRELPIGS